MMYLVLTAAEGQNRCLKVARGLKKALRIRSRSARRRKGRNIHMSRRSKKKKKKKKKTYGVDKKDYAYMGIDIISSESSPI